MNLELSETQLENDPAKSLSPDKTWQWRGWRVNYRQVGETGPAVLMVHGFGASVGHWRKNLPAIGAQYRCFAIDLIGFGASAKPSAPDEIEYTFETWSAQIVDFIKEVIGEPVYLVANSIGCVAVMQAAIDAPEMVVRLALLNCSLRLLHERKRDTLAWYKRLGAPLLQQVLTIPTIGNFFFQQLARRETVRNILYKAYYHREAVSDELIDILLKPAGDPGAVGVFLAFSRYDRGALPEDLLPNLPCDAIVLWGDKDPWEPIALGRAFADYPRVKKFYTLPNVGHCPQDESPELVNPILLSWLENGE
jgi:pimeloyl-ACP methyl ester carboxylesterase